MSTPEGYCPDCGNEVPDLRSHFCNATGLSSNDYNDYDGDRINMNLRPPQWPDRTLTQVPKSLIAALDELHRYLLTVERVDLERDMDFVTDCWSRILHEYDAWKVDNP